MSLQVRCRLQLSLGADAPHVLPVAAIIFFFRGRCSASAAGCSCMLGADAPQVLQVAANSQGPMLRKCCRLQLGVRG